MSEKTIKSVKTKSIILKVFLLVLFVAFSVCDFLIANLFVGDATMLSEYDRFLRISLLVLIVAAIVFFIIGLFKKKLRLLNIILSFVLAFSLIVIVVETDSALSKPYCEFTPEKWSECRYHYRQYMIEDLEKQYDIVGMKREDVESLLGQTENYPEESEQAYYWIGTASVFNNFYIITYDDNGIVSDAVIEAR